MHDRHRHWFFSVDTMMSHLDAVLGEPASSSASRSTSPLKHVLGSRWWLKFLVCATMEGSWTECKISTVCLSASQIKKLEMFTSTSSASFWHEN